MKTRTEKNEFSRGAFLRRLALALPLLPAGRLLAQTDVAAVPAGAAQDEAGLRALVELARSDLRTEKCCVIARNLPLTDTEAEAFWPLQREYDGEFTKLLDDRLAAIIQFVKQYGAMTDANATALAQKSFDLETRRTALKRKYFPKFSKAVSALKAARFFQIENQINMLLDLQVASALPLIK